MTQNSPGSFPNFPGKHAHDAFFSPHDYLAYIRQLGIVPDFAIPDGVIFCFQNSLVRHIEQQYDVEPVALFAGKFSAFERRGAVDHDAYAPSQNLWPPSPAPSSALIFAAPG